MIVIAVDPGKSKIGIAVVNSVGGTITRKVCSRTSFCEDVDHYMRNYPTAHVVCGDGTKSKDVVRELREYGIKDIHIVDESNTTWEARKGYWARHRKPWYLFFMPSSMLKPRRNIDDFAAWVIAHRYIDANRDLHYKD